jgi:hypothetical protein
LTKTWLTFQTIRQALKTGVSAKRWALLSLLRAKRLSVGSKTSWQELGVGNRALLLRPPCHRLRPELWPRLLNWLRVLNQNLWPLSPA